MGRQISDEEYASDPYSRFIDENLERHGTDRQSRTYREHTLAMWQAAREALAQIRDVKPLDKEIAGWLIVTIDELLNGQTPTEIAVALVRQPGAPRDSLAVIEAKKYAILYMQAVAAGDIDDPSYVTMLSGLYGCSKQTVRNWRKLPSPAKWEEFQPHREAPLRVKSLRRFLNICSAYYSLASQAGVAVRERNGKRKLK